MITFHGAAGTVTGSRHLLTAADRQVLLDCGLFQGPHALRARNWDFPSFEPSTLDAVVLSHAHLDHSGYLPRLVRHGFAGPIYCTPATADLVAILLRDAAFLEEEQAAASNRYGWTKHRPALPLFTLDDAEAAVRQLEPQPFHTTFPVADRLHVRYTTAGHILGAATVQVTLPGGERLVYSGDLGRKGQPILRDPEPAPAADVLVLESTYGDREHVDAPEVELARIITHGAERGGAIIIPAFAVGRTQELLWRLREMEEAGTIPVLPTYLDSPMAIDVTALYGKHRGEHDAGMARLLAAGRAPLATANFRLARTVPESKALNDLRGPFILVSASGMATGGRVLHHLRARLPDWRTVVLLTGFQAAGTRGRALQDGVETVRIHGQEVPVKALVVTVDGLSAHADQSDLLEWATGASERPRAVYLVHGEPRASSTLAARLEERGIRAWVAEDRQTVRVTGAKGRAS